MRSGSPAGLYEIIMIATIEKEKIKEEIKETPT